MSKTHRIALYPGDGIGVDVTDQAVRVLERAQSLFGFKLAMTRFPWSVDWALKEGKTTCAPPDYLEQLKPFDAIFLGALGDPRRMPDHITLEPIVRIRQAFDLYACTRPARLLPGVKSKLADPGAIDMVVVRENSEGEYFSCGGRFKQGRGEEIAVQTAIHSRLGIERILRFSYELAAKRRKRLTMITKSNAMKFGMVLWDDVLEDLRRQYPQIETDKLHIDAAAMDFVRRPSRFDVVVASNLFGDILTDLSAAIVGGMGVAPSANIDPTRTHPSMFEPVHGSSPDIIGKGIANPAAASLSAAMMLDWLGAPAASKSINAAVEHALAHGHTTPDLGGSLTTTTMTDRILDAIR